MVEGRSMFRQDYIMRTIRVFIDALILLIRSRRDQDYHRARSIIAQTWEDIFGLSTASVMALSERTLLSMLLKRSGGVVDTALMAARLFKEDGALAMADGQEDEGRGLYLKALNCYLEIAVEPSVGVDDFRWISEEIDQSGLVTDPREAIEELLRLLAGTALPMPTTLLLFSYYERYGQYGKAEDTLFHVMDDNPAEPEIAELGLGFYERLESMADDRLEEGGLPRDEVREGLEQLRDRIRRYGYVFD